MPAGHSVRIPVHSSHRWRRLVPAIALFAAACGGGDATKSIVQLQSWRATIDLADTARVSGWVTPRYAAQLRDRAREDLAAARKAASARKTTPGERDSLTAAARSLESSLAKLERAGS